MTYTEMYKELSKKSKSKVISKIDADFNKSFRTGFNKVSMKTYLEGGYYDEKRAIIDRHIREEYTWCDELKNLSYQFKSVIIVNCKDWVMPISYRDLMEFILTTSEEIIELRCVGEVLDNSETAIRNMDRERPLYIKESITKYITQ